MHAVNILEDLFGIGRNGGRRSLVQRAVRRIGKEGRGVMVIIRDVRERVIQARPGRGRTSCGPMEALARNT